MRRDRDILVSVVIPVKNGDYWLRDTLKAIFNQRIKGGLEVIVIDSGSTDKSLDIISQFPVRLVQIEPSTFNHGRTRNLGVLMAKGEYVVMTVQDARPANEYWLQNLLDGFVDDTVAGVCGSQIVPHDKDKNPLAWFRPQRPPKIKKYQFPVSEFRSLPADTKRQVCGWDDVTAMYRRNALIKLPFRDTSFAEDLIWSMDAIMKGYSIVYNPAARVYHYHHDEPEFVLKRAFSEYFYFYRMLGYKPAPVNNGLMRKLRDIKLLIREEKLTWPEKWKWFVYNQRLRKRINESVHLFHEALAKGPQGLAEMHRELCSTVPQAVKPS
ncbi:MAG TPA: glycosyltransferase [Flavisolibacter sp.]|jgi:rhamnosyltransferase|nr:glycosyltransferase [Flavisolibacter sp.]